MTLSNSTKQNYGAVAQIIPNRLYFASFDTPPLSDNQIVYLNIDESVHYDSFYDDFGPLNLSVLYRFCEALNAIIQSKEKRKIFVFTDNNPRNRVNGVFLVASYMIVYQNLTADQAYVRIQAAEPPPFIGFRDAAMGPPSYLLHVQHVIKSVEKALHLGWLNFKTFDPDEYEYFERVENGDLNWIVPDKILSFCGPHDRSYMENEYCYHAPEVYFDYFREHNVSTIIRLNRKVYDSKRFINAGFDHVDLFFIDGSTPSDEIVLKFINIVENARGAVAIHCKAGLGRTGTLIACWMMKHFKLTAPQCMAWLRICRPGSVIGPQQQFLIEKEQWCRRLGQKQAQSATVAVNPLSTAERPSENANKNGTSKSPTNSLLQAHNIKCKITNNNNNVVNTAINNSTKSKTVTRLANELDDCGLRELGNLQEVGPMTPNSNTTPKVGKTYSLRSQKTTIEDSDTNGSLIDETAINEFGQSQGDRLCEMKAKAQHHHNAGLEHTLVEQLKQPASTSVHGGAMAVVPRTTTGPPMAPPAATAKPATRFSSATTPIKQLKLSSCRRTDPSSTYKINRPSVSAGYHNMNVTNRIPISKVTVSTNCRPSILRNNTNKKYTSVRNTKPYSPANRVALDFARFNAGMSSNKNEKMSSVGLIKRNSTSSIYSINKADYQLPGSANLTSLRKYELRPRIPYQTPTRFDPAAILSPNSSALISTPTSRTPLSTSKSAGRLGFNS